MIAQTRLLTRLAYDLERCWIVYSHWCAQVRRVNAAASSEAFQFESIRVGSYSLVQCLSWSTWYQSDLCCFHDESRPSEK